jgi:hypothetical protein
VTKQDDTTARERFRELVRAEWAYRTDTDAGARAANEQVEATNAMVQTWADNSSISVRSILMPLLDDESPHVRYAAAAHLLYHGAADQARVTLEELADDEELGSVGTLADGALLGWERNQ